MRHLRRQPCLFLRHLAPTLPKTLARSVTLENTAKNHLLDPTLPPCQNAHLEPQKKLIVGVANMEWGLAVPDNPSPQPKAQTTQAPNNPSKFRIFRVLRGSK